MYQYLCIVMISSLNIMSSYCGKVKSLFITIRYISFTRCFVYSDFNSTACDVQINQYFMAMCIIYKINKIFAKILQALSLYKNQ